MVAHALDGVVAAASSTTGRVVKAGVLDWDHELDELRLTKIPFSSSSGPQVSDLTVDTARQVGVFTSTAGDDIATSGLREIYKLDDTAPGATRMRGTFWGGPHFGASDVGDILPQHGLVLGWESDGTKHRGIIVWQNIFFGTNWSLLTGVWTGALDGTPATFNNRQIGHPVPSLGRTANVISGTRSGGVTTYVLDTNKVIQGSYVSVNVTDSSADGWRFVLTSSGNTITVTDPGTDGPVGTGTIYQLFPYDVEARRRTGNIVQVRVKQTGQNPWPDWVEYDSLCGMVLPGGSGNYWSAPAATITNQTQLSFRFTLIPNDWTPSGDQTVLAKYVSAGNQRCIWIRLKTTGAIETLYSTTGGTTGSATSSVVPGTTDGQPAHIRVDYDGLSATKTLTYYTGTTASGPWTLLSGPHTLSGAGAIFNSTTSPVEIGSALVGTNSLLQGRVQSMVVFPNLTETSPLIDYHACNFDNGVTSVDDRISGTGVVWTANGTAVHANTGKITDAPAWAVDVDEAGNWADRTANPTPTTTTGGAGVIPAHIGTDARSQVVHAQDLFDQVFEVNVYGSGSSAEAVIADLAVAVSLDGGVTGSSGAAADLTVAVALDGSSNSASGVTLNLVSAVTLDGSASAASGVTAVTNLTVGLGGTVDAASGVQSDLSIGTPPSLLDGPVSAASGATGALSLDFTLAGNVTSSAQISSDLALAIPLDSGLNSTGFAGADLQVMTPLEGGVRAASFAEATLFSGSTPYVFVISELIKTVEVSSLVTTIAVGPLEGIE